MSLGAMMTAATSWLLTSLHLGDCDGLWEISCSPHSWLSSAGEECGLRPRCINLHNGYDLYKADSWDRLRDLRRKRRPRRLWFSLPGTKWCAWGTLDYQAGDRQGRLAEARRKERRLLWNVNVFIKEALMEDDMIEIYFEWPHPNQGWLQQPMVDLSQWMEQQGIPWLPCRLDGCNYGLRDEKDHKFIKKQWLVRTTSEAFHKKFRSKTCPGNHGTHSSTDVLKGTKETYYPWRMVKAFTSHWRDQHVPHKHLRLLEGGYIEHENEESDLEDLHPIESYTEEALLGLTSSSTALGPTEEALIGLTSSSTALGPINTNDYRTIIDQYVNQGTYTMTALEHVLSLVPSGHRQQKHSRWDDGSGLILVLGAYSHGNFCGVSKATGRHSKLVLFINNVLRRCLPTGSTWSSLMVSFNRPALPHRDVHNAKGSQNHLVCLGDYVNGGLWLAGAPNEQQPVVRRWVYGQLVKGYVVPTKDRVVTFDPHIWHSSQKWTGWRVAISAYTTRMAYNLVQQDRAELDRLQFPVCARLNMELAQESLAVTQPTMEPEELPEGVSKEELERWKANVSKFHKAAGHPSNRNLAKIISDAGHAPWKVQVAINHHCPACASLRPGGTSSGQIPPASTHPQYEAWQAVAIDSAEWIPPKTKQKVKFLVFMDVATKLRVVQPLYVMDFLQMRQESGEDLIKAFSERWLGTFPKPQVVLMDAAKSFSSEPVREFFSDVNILTHFVAEKEAWAHGTVEAAVQDVKQTASAIFLDDRSLPLEVALQLATSALNSTEYTAGFSSFQWAYGTAYRISDEDVMTYQAVKPSTDFAKLVTARQRAEEIARTTRATRVLGKLQNTTVRQPLRNFSPMDLIKVWRRVWPAEQHRGPRGGFKKAGRPHWIGPGRVVFSEVLPHQKDLEDDRRHIVWVLIGTQLLRCSVHSVRPVTEDERFVFETTSTEKPSQWTSLADVLPKKEYVDLSDQVPDEAETQLPALPSQPDASTTVLPTRRLRQKVTFKTGDYVDNPVRDRLQHDVDEEVNVYGPENEPATASTTRPLGDEDPEQGQPTKKVKTDYAINWIEELEADAFEESKEMDLFTAMEDVNEFLKVEFDLPAPQSNRQRKLLEKNPVAYMVKKMRDAEVSLGRLSAQERSLFERAKAKEVRSFVANEAVRRCLDQEEVNKAYSTGRIVRARWVLTWKLTPPEDLKTAMDDASKNAETTLYTKDGKRKAKARVVLLGFEHPSLLDPNFKNSSPVQSTLGRNMLYVLSTQNQWDLEGLDLETAFLQTLPTEADRELWTSGVQELRSALGVGEEGILRILKNIYGSTTAPRGLWLSLHKKLTELGGVPILGERCLWVWFSKSILDRGLPKLLGAMGGHVDDFHRLGDKTSGEWMAIREQIDQAYKWGMVKSKAYRHAGTDIETTKDNNGYNKISINQDYYVESLMDVEIEPERLRQDGRLTQKEIGACRGALGALQWLAVQTQPQLCSRCNLLLTEVVTEGTLQTAREIQTMIHEVRREPARLEYFKLPTVKHWTDLVFISMGDQAHNNRPRGDSTGGLLTLVAGPEAPRGQVCPMMLIGWRTWKLKRKAIGSNDAEVQSILEAEDQNFRVRLLWTELHGGGGARQPRDDLVEKTETQALMVKGILCTDSRGGYDAVEVNESPLLGLSNMRSALQAFQLRDNLERVACELRWLASDYDLADALTKKRADSRIGLLKFLRTYMWSIAFDPTFTSSRKNKQKGHSAVGQINDHLRQSEPVHNPAWLNFVLGCFMQMARLQANDIGHNAAISACSRARRWQRALALLPRMAQDFVHPTRISFNSAIESCETQWKVTVDLLAAMQRADIVPDDMSHGRALASLARAAQGWALALSLGSANCDLVSHNVLIASCGQGSAWAASLALLAAMPSRELRDVVSFNSAITACGSAGRWQLAISLLMTMVEADLRRDAIGLAAAMTACEKEGLWQMAVNLFTVLADVHQDVVTYSTAMAAYGRGSQWQAVLVLLWEMADADVSPNEFSFHAAIAACADEGAWQLALALLGAMDDRSIRRSA
eukprot:s3447_g1.t3